MMTGSRIYSFGPFAGGDPVFAALARHFVGQRDEELEEVILLSEFHLHKKGSGQIEQMSEMDGKFHKILYEASNSRILEHVLTDFHKYVQLARTMSIEAPERAEKSIEEHREILEAIKAKDAATAEQLANEHILHVMENLHLEE